MEKLTKDICDIISVQANTIDQKIRGLNFLELLKIKLVEELSTLIDSQKSILNQVLNFETIINENSRNLKVSINYYMETLSISKKSLDKDSLFISFNESSTLDIYKDEKNLISIILYKNTGLSLPKNTVINSKRPRNILFLEINSEDTEEILTKQKMN